MTVDIDMVATAERIAEVGATEIMSRYRNLEKLKIHMKGINDPVTEADKAAEEALTRIFTSISPGSVVVGEESYAEDHDILKRFSGEHDVWVIDPIDGTRNYINGVPEFAVMVALVRKNETIAAWIHDPNSGDTLAAEKGGGVWLGPNKMHLAGQEAGMKTVGLSGSTMRKFLARPEIAAVTQGFPTLAPSSAAAFDYARFFTGDQVFAKSTQARAHLLITYRRAMPWDHLAGMMMLKEAGGQSADWNGKPYAAENPEKGILAAADKQGWELAHSQIKDVLSLPAAP